MFLRNRLGISPLVPAKAGTQGPKAKNWIPAYAGLSGIWN
jgi:hypothetical protein